MKPFLNWPGGKTRLIGEISKRYPKNLGWGYNRDDTKQAELAGWAWEMRRKGARVVISNSDPHNTNPSDNFFDDLYGGVLG